MKIAILLLIIILIRLLITGRTMIRTREAVTKIIMTTVKIMT